MITEDDIKEVEGIKKMLSEKLKFEFSWEIVSQIECLNKLVNNLSIAPVSFQLFQELYGSYVQMDDRFETVHLWSEELALKNKGRWTPILISKSKYESEKLHPWNN